MQQKATGIPGQMAGYVLYNNKAQQLFYITCKP